MFIKNKITERKIYKVFAKNHRNKKNIWFFFYKNIYLNKSNKFIKIYGINKNNRFSTKIVFQILSDEQTTNVH